MRGSIRGQGGPGHVDGPFFGSPSGSRAGGAGQSPAKKFLAICLQNRRTAHKNAPRTAVAGQCAHTTRQAQPSGPGRTMHMQRATRTQRHGPLSRNYRRLTRAELHALETTPLAQSNVLLA